MLELSKSVRLFVTLHACFFVIGCNEHSENEIGHEAKTTGFTNKMAIGEASTASSPMAILFVKPFVFAS